jgi:hypothetical protein
LNAGDDQHDHLQQREKKGKQSEREKKKEEIMK